MRTSRRLQFSSTWIALGVAAIVCTFPGSLFGDDKKPAKPAPAKAASAPAKAATPAGAAASHLPGASHLPVAGGTARPATPGPASRPGAPGTAAHPGMPERPGTAGVPGARPGGAMGGRNVPVGGRQFGGGTARPGSVRASQIRGEHAVYHGPAGRRGYERQLPGGRRIYADGRGRGYIHNEYMYGGHRVYQRVYYANGVAYPRYYNPYVYGGVELAVYAPARYYAPAFYGWAYNPWAVPIAFSFGFAAAPWYGYYGGYFTPYPVYASPSLWLTDYMVAQSLQQSYQAQQDAMAQQQQQMQPQAFAAPMTPDVKQQIAEEVKRQIALENAEQQTAQTGMPDPRPAALPACSRTTPRTSLSLPPH